MRHNKSLTHIPQYEYTGTNQHEDRYKRIEPKKINVLTLSVKYEDNKEQMWTLMAICNGLNIAPSWTVDNDNKQTMSIDIVASKSI